MFSWKQAVIDSVCKIHIMPASASEKTAIMLWFWEYLQLFQAINKHPPVTTEYISSHLFVCFLSEQCKPKMLLVFIKIWQSGSFCDLALMNPLLECFFLSVHQFSCAQEKCPQSRKTVWFSNGKETKISNKLINLQRKQQKRCQQLIATVSAIKLLTKDQRDFGSISNYANRRISKN